MCEDYWEWELARRRKILALEEPWPGEVGDDEDPIEDAIEDKPEPVILPPTPLVEEKRRGRPMLAR
ncbi:MAG TPA: hypothetical protein VII27_07235 [Thermoplasmata archaeon]|uniref:Uncharacterized protein n=1 Tax=uncultured euryarchaeote Rifle_16ft_4_minimus_39 TaxID=1665197 RepID=A0A0H4T7W2_9EURY|nr:hypothetical protein [uncultured euryarchaeote Rifle_16ft_4_minimus_39]